jgi:hypothetical protein
MRRIFHAILFGLTLAIAVAVPRRAAAVACSDPLSELWVVLRDASGSAVSCVNPGTPYEVEVIGPNEYAAYCIKNSNPALIHVPLLAQGFSVPSLSGCEDSSGGDLPFPGQSFTIVTDSSLPASGISGAISPACYDGDWDDAYTQESPFAYPACADSQPPAAGLELWLKADAGVTSSAGKVSSWQDQSGRGHHATMSLASRQPSLVTGALGGKPVIRFSGAQSLGLATPVQPSAFTVFVVGKNSMPTESFSMILGPGGNWPNNQLRWENGTQALFVGTSNALPVVTATVGNTRVYHRLSASYNGSALSVYRDGNLVSTRTFQTTGPWTLAQVGAWYSTYFMRGDLAEIVMYNRALAAGERSTVEGYLKSKYALP